MSITDELREYFGKSKGMFTDHVLDIADRIDEEHERQLEALKRDEWSAGFNAGCDAVNAAIEEGKAHYEVENAKLRKLVYDLLNAWDDMQHEVVTGPTFDDCERHAYELGIEVVP